MKGIFEFAVPGDLAHHLSLPAAILLAIVIAGAATSGDLV